jgi:endogenous inhibitor of DNA gyrase (YacG/DUF329 family)
VPDLQRCAYCRKQPVEHRWRPFCSERCKMADLGHWISGDYRIASTASRDGQDAGSPGDEPHDADES